MSTNRYAVACNPPITLSSNTDDSMRGAYSRSDGMGVLLTGSPSLFKVAVSQLNVAP
jgi:hypothetical protein